MLRCNIQIKFNLEANQLKLPLNHNHILHGIVLKWLGNQNYENFLHNCGFTFNNRIFKLYSFSELKGEYKLLDDGRIMFYKKIDFYIGSHDEKFIDYLFKNSIFREKITILDQDVFICGIDMIDTTPKNNSYTVETLSPVTVYSSFESCQSKKTLYYHPNDKNFAQYIQENLIKKYNSFYGKNPENSEFYIKTIGTPKEIKKRYKGFLIKGWHGKFKIAGSMELLKMAFDSGLGSKNSQGFGFIREVPSPIQN